MEITREVFESQRQRRFGTANPERMPLTFWEWMVRGSEEARTRDGSFEPEDPAALGHSPYDVRTYFGEELDVSAGPIWNFERMGATRTPHPDGRMICIGGEHEDYYDPDFCIYNDVVVLDLDGSIAIYGYPEDLFPPTDFHTATRLGDRVIVIGRLGYAGERHPGTTPVFSLDLATYRIEPLPSQGTPPGWIFGHQAELAPDGLIHVRGGEVYEEDEEEQDGETSRIRRNFDDFAYDPASGRWTRLTDRKWRQFSICDEGGKSFMLGPPFRGGCSIEGESLEMPDLDPEIARNLEDTFVHVLPEALFPRSFAYETLECEEPYREERVLVAGVPISIRMEAFSIDVVVEGEMDEARATAIAEDIKNSVEADTGRPCVLKAYG